MKDIIKLERISLRNNSYIIRIIFRGNVVSFEGNEETELKLVKLFTGGPVPDISIPIDVIKCAK